MVTIADSVRGHGSSRVSVGALTADEESPTVGEPGRVAGGAGQTR